ncbi:hypothetical protein C8P68_104258 [Mucilaginibacter yixingensis]|uniref:Uncharacterized protein n=2 Tax=Mucilaginibacter yixingensis TaxID=1295612 RepID=A0A2T5J9T0_9SPHI|nr:hypothetical protein C8P68_104258 [Mucilaginibacter yixingensis]
MLIQDIDCKYASLFIGRSEDGYYLNLLFCDENNHGLFFDGSYFTYVQEVNIPSDYLKADFPWDRGNYPIESIKIDDDFSHLIYFTGGDIWKIEIMPLGYNGRLLQVLSPYNVNELSEDIEEYFKDFADCNIKT